LDASHSAWSIHSRQSLVHSFQILLLIKIFPQNCDVLLKILHGSLKIESRRPPVPGRIALGHQKQHLKDRLGILWVFEFQSILFPQNKIVSESAGLLRQDR